MLSILDAAWEKLLLIKRKTIHSEDRVTYFLSLGKSPFTQKEYMEGLKIISTAPLRRVLKKAVDERKLRTEGSGNQTIYMLNPTLSNTP